MVAIRCGVLAGMLLVLGGLAGAQQPSGGKVELKVVKYDELGDIIRQNRGKVVVVDFWATNCGPCKELFPELVEMHRKYARDGLVAISVSTDDLSESPESKEVALKFLQKQNATFTNLLLDEKGEFWAEKLHSNALPFCFVFNRDGKWYQFKGKDSYAQIEPLVQQLLQQK